MAQVLPCDRGACSPGALGVQGAGPALLGFGSTRGDQGAPCARAGGRDLATPLRVGPQVRASSSLEPPDGRMRPLRGL